MASAQATIVEDLKDERVPSALYWTTEHVAEWIEELGFPQYKACFLTNMIDGRKLCCIHASAFPRIGITDFEHIKIIAKNIRDLIYLEEPYWNRSIAEPPKNNLGMYLELKSHTGKVMDTTTFKQMYLNCPDPKWQPPLSNQCLIMPRN
ncbi:sterile alpha motif domain-containing protein 15-like [Plakobranchus ocellatus]|uniref:Sterile alpha motif domain-containing protein 15-like n=1 Tax=Plakobranchus ocellatus TaxID=259542 RepID=A0AAV3Y184_9GAST|nr:sterile alpha motif domain-containing protein 15-like [Plakobranchus ocellatus]